MTHAGGVDEHGPTTIPAGPAPAPVDAIIPGNLESPFNKQRRVFPDDDFVVQGGFGPEADKRTNAFMMAQGASAARSRAEIKRRIEAVERARGRFIEDSNRDEGRGLEGIGTQFESRGLFRSGRRERDQGRLSSDAATDRSRANEDFDLQLEAIQRARSAIGGGVSFADKRQEIERGLIDDAGRRGVITGDLFRRQPDEATIRLLQSQQFGHLRNPLARR